MGDDVRRKQLRATFQEDAERYHRARPTYPDELLDDLRREAGIGQGRRVLEIGCGTGQLTVPLAERGCEIIAVDLGARTVEIAKCNLRKYPSVQVHHAAFEDWELSDVSFYVVVSATAFHWLEPGIRVFKSAEALRLPSASEMTSDTDEFDRTEAFQPAKIHRYEWEQSYSAIAYSELLLTYSDHLSLSLASRQGLLRCISELIDSKYNGSITERYLTELLMLSRR